MSEGDIVLANGIHTDIPASVYHRRELGVVSNTALSILNQSPAHYRAWVDGAATDDEDSEPLRFGSAFHCALLEPDLFASTYAVEPIFGDCRKTENKARRDEWRESHKGATLIGADMHDTLVGMVRSVRSHPLVGRMIANGTPEQTVIWTDPQTGLRCKSRMDYHVPGRRMVVDVKTTKDASAAEFRRSAFNYGYHRQNALYREGLAACGVPAEYFIIVAVEKRPPYAVAIYQLDEQFVSLGYGAVRSLIATMADCARTDTWPGYSQSIQSLAPPPWAA